MSNLTSSIQLTQQSTYKLNNGLHIPVAGFGVYEIPADEAEDAVYHALKVGYRHIDGAQAYKNSKETAAGIARFLKDHPSVSRQDIWFTSKVATQYLGYEKTKESVKIIADDVKESIEYVDLILLHSPKASKEDRLGSWKALQEYVTHPSNDVLNIKSIGVSNYGIEHLEELLHWDGLLVKPVINQLELHPWLPRLKLREYLVSHDILIEAYTPLTRGQKFGEPELVNAAEKYGYSKAEVLLKWSYLQGFIVLAKSANPERTKQNLNVLPPGKHDELDQTTHLGKLDLEPEILESLNKPDSHDVLTWNGVDPTEYKHTQ